MIARLYTVQGGVQGVGFRWFVQHVAGDLHLTGYVRNLYDGNVEVYAAGKPADLERLRSKLEQGPLGARVTRVEESPAPVENYKSFVITY